MKKNLEEKWRIKDNPGKRESCYIYNFDEGRQLIVETSSIRTNFISKVIQIANGTLWMCELRKLPKDIVLSQSFGRTENSAIKKAVAELEMEGV